MDKILKAKPAKLKKNQTKTKTKTKIITLSY